MSNTIKINMNLNEYLNKDINIIMRSSGGAIPGTLINIDTNYNYFTMSTCWSSCQYFKLSDLQSFWCSDDKPTE